MFLVVVICQTSCAVLPFPTLPETMESTIAEQQLRSIKTGRSSKDQIAEQFGAPPWVSTDDSHWKYEVRRHKSWGWGICWSGPYGVFFDCVSFDKSLKVQILEIYFDDAGTIKDWKSHAMNFSECIDSEECSFLAPKNLDLKPNDAWFEDASRFDLVDRDGLLYEAQASSPFTGTRSSYYEDGTKAGEFQFEMGLRHGECTIRHDDGSVYKTMIYEVGVLQGPLTKWYRNGRKYSVAYYEHDRRSGVMTIWDDSGEVIAKDCYRDGYLVFQDSGICN